MPRCLGGTPQKLVTDIDSNITFSPDGRQIAYFRFNNPEAGKERLLLLPADGGEEKILYSGPIRGGLQDPAWSPDGKTIVCMVLQPGNAFSGLVTLRGCQRKAEIVFHLRHGHRATPGVDARRERPARADPPSAGIRSFSFLTRTGKLHDVTRDTNNYSEPSLAADGRTVVSVLSQPHYNVFT